METHLRLIHRYAFALFVENASASHTHKLYGIFLMKYLESLHGYARALHSREEDPFN